MLDPLQFLSQAAFLNEQGCVLLESGLQHEAFEIFIAALETVSTLAYVIEVNAHQCGHHRTLSLPPGSLMEKQSCASPQESCCVLGVLSNEGFCSDQQQQRLSYPSSHHTANQLDLSEEPHNFVYNQAFRFTAPGGVAFLYDQPEDATHYIKLYRAILAFNSALSFHQRSIGAIESVKRKAEALASDLYLDAMNLLRDCDLTLDVYRVMAATVNNAAMLFYEMQEFAKFEDFQAELHLLLVDMENSFPRSIEQHCLQCLSFNATLLSPPRTAAAA